MSRRLMTILLARCLSRQELATCLRIVRTRMQASPTAATASVIVCERNLEVER